MGGKKERVGAFKRFNAIRAAEAGGGCLLYACI